MEHLDGEFRKTISIVKKVLGIIGILVYTRDDNLTRFRITLRKFHYYFIVIYLVIVVISLFAYLTVGESFNFIHTTEVFPCALYCIIGFVKMIALQSKIVKVENLVYELERLFPTEQKDKDTIRMIIDHVKQLKLTIMFITVLNMFFIWTWNLSSLVAMAIEYLRYGTAEKQMPYYLYIPWETEEMVPFILGYIFNICSGSTGALAAVGPDIFFVAMANHIVLQFKILQIKMNQNIENILPETNQRNLNLNHNHKEEMYDKLVECVHIHKELIKHADTVEEIFTLTTLINFLCSTVLICCVGFQITVIIRGMKAVIFVIFLITGLTQTFFVCRAGQTMIDDSNAIGDALYNSPWYLTDKKYRNMVACIILRAQRPQVFTALRFSVVCLKSFASIISSSYSYFTLLNTTYRK